MPKIKTHSGAKKRVAVTKTGKLKVASINRRHDIKGCKDTKRKRRLRKGGLMAEVNVPQIKRLIPYK